MHYFNKLTRRLSKTSESAQLAPNWLKVLAETPGISKTAEERVAMTISCRDCDSIPKVKEAGSLKKIGGKEYQVMHNGILVEAKGYFGDWMQEIIATLKGHHEPQEEKVFFELLKQVQSGGTMIELGSYWSYYSIWFNKKIKDARNFCCEPDPVNLALGKRNAEINTCKNVTFINAAAGKDDGARISFTPQEGEREDVSISIRSVDGLVQENDIERIDILHMDIQGVEFDAIIGAQNAIKQGKVRFVIVSTHHYFISNDPLMHEKCLQKLKDLGGNIIVEHAIHESFSGDGLIVASFAKEDEAYRLEISENRMQDSLFRSYNEDLDILRKHYERLRGPLE